MLHGQKSFFRTTYGQWTSYPYVVQTKILCPYNIQEKIPYVVWKNVFFHTTYEQLVYMFYGQFVYIFHIDKDMLDDTEQFYNESIDMTYHRKIYMNIIPTGHNL